MAMPIGNLSRRTGVPVKILRTYEDLGLVYTVGRSAGNYRLFEDEAVWCVQVVETLRELGLTLAEIQELTTVYLQTADPVGPRIAHALRAARGRTEQRIADLARRIERIDEFESSNAAELTQGADFRAYDPRARARET